MWALASRSGHRLATGNLVYTISVTNFGPSSASGVVVTDALPAGVSFVSASGNGINSGGVVNWTLGTLANGAGEQRDGDCDGSGQRFTHQYCHSQFANRQSQPDQ